MLYIWFVFIGFNLYKRTEKQLSSYFKRKGAKTI